MPEWILVVEANLDVGVEAKTKEAAFEKAERLLEKIMIPNMILEDGMYVSIDLELRDVIKI